MAMLTNEERRVGIYHDGHQPINPAQVTPDTPLEALNLNWRERDLPERLRTRHVHRLHPYLGKFIPQLVEVFLRKYFQPGQAVLDPFVGSGTTLVQANELGIHAIGYDVSAFNVILCCAKTQVYDLKQMNLSRSARSARLTTHYDLDFPKKPQVEPYWCYKHRRICEPTTEALKFIRRYGLDTIRRVIEFAQVRTDARAEVYHADSREADFPPIDGIITSPPYVGLIDYHDQHAYTYYLLNLTDLSEREIGAASNGASERAKAQYVADIVEVFRRASCIRDDASGRTADCGGK